MHYIIIHEATVLDMAAQAARSARLAHCSFGDLWICLVRFICSIAYIKFF
jgi:hypothetical protein